MPHQRRYRGHNPQVLSFHPGAAGRPEAGHVPALLGSDKARQPCAGNGSSRIPAGGRRRRRPPGADADTRIPVNPGCFPVQAAQPDRTGAGNHVREQHRCSRIAAGPDPATVFRFQPGPGITVRTQAAAGCGPGQPDGRRPSCPATPGFRGTAGAPLEPAPDQENSPGAGLVRYRQQG